jgi:hypothetical protein
LQLTLLHFYCSWRCFIFVPQNDREAPAHHEMILLIKGAPSSLKRLWGCGVQRLRSQIGWI